jgi:amino acid adenylation domain-containing protein
LAASLYQDLPFEQLVDALQPERDMSRNALFQVAFSLHAPVDGAVDLSGLALSTISVDAGTAKFDLTLELADTPQGLQGSIDYNLDLFDPTTIRRLAAHLENLLAAATGTPECPVAELGLLSDAERHQLVAEWNDTARGVARGRLIHHLFEQQAERSPDAAAVLWADGVLSYRDLDQRANRLARHLRTLGIGRGAMVAVLLPRDGEMVIPLLAILKAGAAYVPFDGHFPAARMRWILASLGIRCLLAKRAGLGLLAEAISGLPDLSHLVLLDAGAPADAVPGFAGTVWNAGALTALSAEPLPAAGLESDFAYVIFTSGSTGTPKGVAVRHRPVVNLIEWVGESFGMGAADRVLFVTSLTFDLSVYDIFGLLAAGGSIRVASEDELREPAALARLLRDEPITFWDSAPAMLQQLAPELAAGHQAAGPSLRLVFLSGDWIPVTLPGQIVAAFPGARVIGLGGATEATVWSNFHPIVEVDPRWLSIPYGRPIWNSRYHVLDEQFGPSPIGIPGDLYIAGECLSSGYAGEPRLTAEKFVPAPFAASPGSVLYRTGDRARYRPDGNLEFLGRLDHQVKIRGFRIELGEIEAALREQPAVREAVALAREDGPGSRRLVAYLLQEKEIDLTELRRELRRRLPEYMIPSAFVVLPEFPVTANGKLDRKALPSPERDQPAAREDFVPPRTPTEAALAAIWREVLAVEHVGAGDNFFELGGHSLNAAQVISRTRSICGVELRLRDLFQAENLATLAEWIDAASLAVAVPGELESLMEELALLSEEDAERLLASGETLVGGGER